MRINAIAIFLLLLVSGAARSQTGFPGLDADSRAEAYAPKNQNGVYSWEDLAEISLWASGAEPGAAAGRGKVSFLEIIRSAAAEFAADPALPGDEKRRGEYLLGFLHKKFLKSYSLQQTRLDTVLVNGRYNCVSSAVLYLILARSSGLDARGVMTRDHAFVSLRVDGENIDVETTNPYGFDPGNRKEFHDQFGRLTGFAYVPAGNYRDRVFISPLELISLILSNRIADLESRGRFAEAVPLAISRAALLEGRSEKAETGSALFGDPRRDIMNRIFNYGASLLKAGKEEEALQWAAEAGPRYPDEERWREFVYAAANNRIVELIGQKKAAEARNFLNAHASFFPGGDYRLLDALILDSELMELASGIKNADGAGEVLAQIDAGEKRGLLETGRIRELKNFVIEKTASLLSGGSRRDWSAAIAYLEKALVQYGPDPRLERSLKNYRSNLAAEYHNRFAAAYNKRNFDEAGRILDEGLAVFPDDRQLLSDRRILGETRR
jgi:tetratricopeptide (TPR) repeat protein